MTEAAQPAPQPGKPPRWRLGRVLLVLVVLSIVFIGLWGLVPIHVDEEVPANLRVTKGQALLKRKGQSEWRAAKGTATLTAKSFVRVEAGAEAFLVHLDGGTTRLTGPAEMELATSRRLIDGRSTFGGVLVRLLGKEPTGRTRVQTITELRPVSGAIVSRASASPTSTLTVTGPNYHSRVPPGAAFRTSLVPGNEAWWESVKGTTSLGLVVVKSETATPVVMPDLAPGSRIIIPAMPEESIKDPKVADLNQRLAQALPSLKQAGPTTAAGIAFRTATDIPGLPYLVGEGLPLGSGPVAKAPALQAIASQAPAAEGLLAVPGAQVRSIPDQEIESHLPSGVKAHVVGGNVVEVTYGGVAYPVRVNVVAGRLEFSGLPLGLDPGPQIERFGKDIPAIFSVETQEGEARVTYLPAETAPAASAAAEGELPVVPHTTLYFSSIPTPDEVSTDWKVVGTNGLLAAWAIFLVRILSTLAGALLRNQEENLKRLFSPVSRAFRGMARVPRAALGGLSRLPAPRAVEIVALVLLYGLIFSFLDTRFVPWVGKGLNILPVITLSTALVGQIDPTVRSMVLSRWGLSHTLGIYPANLAVAVGSVAFSRAVALSPGILIGTPGGLKSPGLKDNQKYKLTLWGMGAVFAVGMAAWAFTYVLPRLASWGGAAAVAASLKGPLSFFQDIALLVFAATLPRVFFGLLPLPQGAGAAVWKRNKVLWTIAFGVASFIFFHTLFNRSNSLAQLMEERGTLVLGTLGASMALGLMAMLCSRHRR